MSDIALEQVKRLAENLTPSEKVKLVEWLGHTLAHELAHHTPPKPRRSLYGLLADLGPGPTDEDIEEVRREMWHNFPREDY
jgi:hypothetical protein